MRVRLNFSVSENALPALVIIRSFDGRLIFYKKVYERQNLLCFCAESCSLTVTVRPNKADFHEKSYYFKVRCSCIDLTLDFNFTADSVERMQTFYLFDENYSFPIEKATLTFRHASGVGITP